MVACKRNIEKKRIIQKLLTIILHTGRDMLKISSLQCRRARGLLGWNHRDLSHKSGVQSHRINSFERNLLHLRQDENKGLYTAFKDEGIIFEEYGEVRLDKNQAKKGEEDGQPSLNTAQQVIQSTPEHVTIDDEEYRHIMAREAVNTSVEHRKNHTRAHSSNTSNA